MKVDSKNIINEIIEENNNYGKIISKEKINLIIFNNNISLSKLIYLDDIARILSTKYELQTTYIEKNSNFTKESLNNIRINYNKYLTYKDLENIEDSILNNNNNLLISDNCLYMENVKLVDENGFYTETLYKLNYLKQLSSTSKGIIIVDDEYNQYASVLKILGIKNITNININNDNNINLSENIDKTRLDAILSNIGSDELEELYQKINKLLYNKNAKKLDTYSQLNDDIEYNMVDLLSVYNEVIIDSIKKLSLTDLTNYIKELIDVTNQYLNNNLDLTQERLNLIIASKIILNNSLDLLGLIYI